MTEAQTKCAAEAGGDVNLCAIGLGRHRAGVQPGRHRKTIAAFGPVLADIYLGTIKKWNDPALKELNPGVALPDQEIVVIHRADSSGSTYIFTDFLSKVSKAWQNKIGTGAAVKWPVGVGVRGNEGMVEAMSKRPEPWRMSNSFTHCAAS